MAQVDAISPIIGTAEVDTLTGGHGSEVISGKGADDTLIGNHGNDDVWGGSGSDLIYGNSGNDKLYGGGGPTYVSFNALTMAANYGATITFEGETAGYRNSLGWYKIDAETEQISDVEIIWSNASLQGSGGELIGGVSQESLDISAGDQVGFFIISNGYSYNTSFFDAWDGSGAFAFQNADDSTATLDSTNPKLVHVDDGGSQTQLLYHTYHTAGFGDDVQLNPDGIDHTVGLLKTDDGLLRLGFEDLYNGGDRDFDDAVFTVDIGTINARVLSGYTYDPVTGAFTISTSGAGTPPPVPNVENDIIHGGQGSDEIHGRAGNDILYGDQGYDTIYGDSGEDVIYGHQGQDIVLGGTGADIIFGETGHDTLDGGKGNDEIDGGDGHDIINGRSGDDTIYGGKGQDEITGSSGADILDGQTGHDTLLGGSGNDVLIGGKGDDVINGGSGSDLVSYADADKRVIVELNEARASGEGSDTITSVENVLGSEHADKIYGNHRDNELSGADGDDRLYGRKGDDQLFGGEGNDTLDGGSGDDLLNGGVGDDTLKGYKGEDTLTGGQGSDTFVYRYANEGGDTISDFSIGEDFLDLASLLVNLGSTSGSNPFNDFLQVISDGENNSVVMLDHDGGGDEWTTELVTLDDIDATQLTIDSLIIV